jgi:hypothetical protein
MPLYFGVPMLMLWREEVNISLINQYIFMKLGVVEIHPFLLKNLG